MTGKDLLFRALRNERTERPAWVPFVGVHGGFIQSLNATEYLRSADHMVRGLEKACELYKPDGIPLSFDLQMEAEVLGCNLEWADEVPPSVVSHPLMGDSADAADLPAFDLAAGRWPMAGEVARNLKKSVGDSVALYGLITGPFTLTSHLRGSELFIDMLMNPDGARSVLHLATEVGKAAAEFYLDAGADVIAVVDPMTSQISPEHFEQFATPYLNTLFAHINACGAYSSLFVCGDATRNLELMCRTACHNLQVDENIPLDLLKTLAQKYGKSFGGNLKLTTVLLLGKVTDAMLDAIRCIDTGGSTGFVLAPGCDLPYATPPRNLQAVSNMVHNDYQRQVARTTVQASTMDSFEDIVLPDYAARTDVTIDVITLDSAGCAPCLYMVDAARKAAAKAAGAVRVREHKIKTREGLGYMHHLGVANIPTICIDGEAAFVSVIPDLDTIVRAIENKAQAKGGA